MLHELLVGGAVDDSIYVAQEFIPTGTSVGSITLPAGIIAGDLLILNWTGFRFGAAPAYSAPAGWNNRNNLVTGTNQSHTSFHWKIANGTESGTTLSIWTSQNLGGFGLLVLRRRSGPILSATEFDYQFYSNLVAENATRTINAVGRTKPLFVYLTAFAGSGVTQDLQFTTSMTPDFEITRINVPGFVANRILKKTYSGSEVLLNDTYRLNTTAGAGGGGYTTRSVIFEIT
jgi:hypothetical protein